MPDLNSIPSLGINVVGAVTGEYGLGEATRGTLRSMEAANIGFTVRKVEVGWHRHLDQTYASFISDENPYPVNLVHTNPDEGLYNSLGSEYFQDKYNIAYWGWELPQLHPAWEYAFDYFDEIWTLSNYSAEAISTISPIPVVKIMPSISLPIPSLGRESLGLPKDKFIFLFMFDFHSTLARKNPFATIEAFKQAFGQANQDVLLVIKFSNAQYHPHRREQLMAQADGWSSIRFIEGHLLKEELHALLNNCNCYVSLHRAEGFGLTMSEAMFYGKPVISTGYSSNIEFMNVGNSYLVKYQLATITQEEGPYLRGSIWAEPDVDHAASLMQYVFENYDQAQNVGRRASEDIKCFLSPQAIGTKIRSRLEYIMKRIGNSNSSIRTNQLRKAEAEVEWWESQAQTWKKTAEQMQRDLKRCRAQQLPM